MIPYLYSALSGVLLALSFPRFDWEFAAWIALVPLFAALHGRKPARAALLGWVTGLVFYGTGLTWIINTLTQYGNIPLAGSLLMLAALVAYLSLYVALFSYLLKRFCGDDPVFLFLAAPPLWTALEYLRSTHLEYGFSWLGLGYSQFKNLPIVQFAEFTGVYGISALIVLVNAGLFCLLYPPLRESDFTHRMRVRIGWVTLGAFLLCAGYGWKTLGGAEPSGGLLKAALIQGNIPQHLKWDPAYREQVLRKYRDLTLSTLPAHPQLVVWPEAVTPFYYGRDEAGSRFVQQVAREIGVPLLFGSPSMGFLNGKPVIYNSAYLMSPDGEILKRYDKIHLVPFGEFVPFRKLLFFVEKLVSGMADFARGTDATVFALNGHTFGVSICFEITFPDLVRRPVERGAQFLINITNDAWFGKSAASYQHIGMVSLRAVENRVPILRAANTGISGAIDAYGRIHPQTGIFEEAALVTSIQPSSQGPTFYSRHGDVFSWICLALTPLMLGWARRSLATPRR